MYIETPIVQCIKSRMAAVKSLQDLTYMDLSDIKTTHIPYEAKELLEKCKNIYELNLTGCGLQSLENLPHLDLTILLLGSNHLKDQELDKLHIYQASLEQISLDRNQIQSVVNLAVFRPFARLAELNLKKNPLCQQYLDYSRKIFDDMQQFFNFRLPQNQQLTLIDHFMRNGEILSDDEGKDNELDGPGWLIEEEESSSRSGNLGESFEEKKSLSSDENNLAQHIDTNMISLYQQYHVINPSQMVQMLNQHEMGIFTEPMENCLDDQMEEEEISLEEQMEAEGTKCAKTKKIKVDEQYKANDFDY